MNDDWECIGTADVDSGQIAIVDPCYVLDDDKYDELIEKYSDKNCTDCHITIDKGAANGQVVSCFGGDGSYPVFIKKSGKMTVAAMIIFDVETYEQMTGKKVVM